MTQKLEMLKGVLQKTIDESDAHFDYNVDWLSAVQDGLYSTDLSVVALEQWLAIWTLTDSHCLTGAEILYQEGVQFVADEWDNILSEDGEGEGL